MARGHPAKRGSVLDSLRSAGDDLVSIGEGVPVRFNQQRHLEHYDWRICDVCVEALPIPFSLTDFGRIYLAELRAMETALVEVAASQTSSGKLPPRQ